MDARVKAARGVELVFTTYVGPQGMMTGIGIERLIVSKILN